MFVDSHFQWADTRIDLSVDEQCEHYALHVGWWWEDAPWGGSPPWCPQVAREPKDPWA